MKILLSNDDGYQAPGIVALHDAIRTSAMSRWSLPSTTTAPSRTR
jgi:broad specificity polyphosphatase/5'/3'-nucleotidase SurE